MNSGGKLSDRAFLNTIYSFSNKAPKELSHRSIYGLMKVIRNTLHLTQTQLAKRAGLPQSHIAKIEAGRTNVQLQTIQRILNALNCDMFVIPKPRQRFVRILADRTKALAKWRVSRLMGTMALERQRPNDRTFRKLCKAEETRLLNQPSSAIWDYEG